MNRLHITCRLTGIQGTIDMPALKGKTLEYTHPLSHIQSCEQVLASGRDYVRRLDKPVLAGLIITTLRHHKLYQPVGERVHPAAINAALCHAKISVLLKMIDVIREYIVPGLSRLQSKHLPTVALGNPPMEESQCNQWARNIAETLLVDVCGLSDKDKKDYELTAENTLIDSVKAEMNAKRNAEIEKQVEARRVAREEAATLKRIKFTIDDLNEEFGESKVQVFIRTHSMGEAEKPMTDLYNDLLTSMVKSHGIDKNQQKLLKTIGTVLYTMDDSKRKTIAERLRIKETKYATAMARLVEIAGGLDKGGVESMEVSIEAIAKPKLTLKERLEAIKAKGKV